MITSADVIFPAQPSFTYQPTPEYAPRGRRLSSPRALSGLAHRQEIFAAEENERCRISRELHDVLGQYVTALRFGLENLLHELEQTVEDVSSVMKLQSIVEQFDLEFHHVALKLRPPVTEKGLRAAVVQYALEWSERSGVRIDLHCQDEHCINLTPASEITLYRILQEALNNIQKHAKARRVSIILENWQGQLQMVIEDDGCGFAVTAAQKSTAVSRKIGLASMRERAELVGGVCEIESSLTQGTTIFVRVPLRHKEQ